MNLNQKIIYIDTLTSVETAGLEFLPSTEGEKSTRLSYKNSPYLTRASEESSAVLKVRSRPWSVDSGNS